MSQIGTSLNDDENIFVAPVVRELGAVRRVTRASDISTTSVQLVPILKAIATTAQYIATGFLYLEGRNDLAVPMTIGVISGIILRVGALIQNNFSIGDAWVCFVMCFLGAEYEFPDLVDETLHYRNFIHVFQSSTNLASLAGTVQRHMTLWPTLIAVASASKILDFFYVYQIALVLSVLVLAAYIFNVLANPNIDIYPLAQELIVYSFSMLALAVGTIANDRVAEDRWYIKGWIYPTLKLILCCLTASALLALNSRGRIDSKHPDYPEFVGIPMILLLLLLVYDFLAVIIVHANPSLVLNAGENITDEVQTVNEIIVVNFFGGLLCLGLTIFYLVYI